MPGKSCTKGAASETPTSDEDIEVFRVAHASPSCE